MSYALDPYSQVERALYVALEQIPEITSAFKVGNRIRPNSRVPHAKGSTSDADRPELVIRCVGSESDVNNTSNASTERRRYRVSIATGNSNSQESLVGINALEFQIKRAVWRLRDLLSAHCPFVSMVRTANVEREIDRREDPTGNATREGWYAVIDVVITCNFQNALEIYV